MPLLSDLSQCRILVTGAGAQLGVYFQRTARAGGLALTGLTHRTLDITNKGEMEEAVDIYRPDVIINCASYNLIDEAEKDPAAAMAVNAQAVEFLAGLCRDRKIFLVHYSSAHVFDGRKAVPYVEEDEASPVNVYGMSKWKGEQAVQKILDDYLIFRLSWVFGTGKNCFLTRVLQWTQTQPVLRISLDEISIPAYSQDIVDMTILALSNGLTGLYHLTSSGSCSRYEYVKYFMKEMGLPNDILPVQASSFGLPAPRPLYSCLSHGKFSRSLNIAIPDWRDGLDRFVVRLKNHEF